LNLNDIQAIRYENYSAERDSLIIAPYYHYRGVNPMRPYITRRANEYRKSINPGNLFQFGFDLGKAFVPKITINTLNLFNNKTGFMLEGGYKPFNPEGQGLYFTWSSNIEFICESWQLKFSPLYWTQLKNTYHGFMIGPVYMYRQLHADNAKVANINDYGEIRYSYRDYERDSHIIGLNLGFFNQRRSGLTFYVTYGINLNHVVDSELTHAFYYPSELEYINERSVIPYMDVSVIYHFRIKKHSARKP
jgi:hypothetical protein